MSVVSDHTRTPAEQNEQSLNLNLHLTMESVQISGPRYQEKVTLGEMYSYTTNFH
jgi:hypothetical protein